MHIDIHGGIGTLNSLLQELSLLMDKVAVAFPSLCSVQPWCNRHRNNGRCGNSGHKLPPYVDVMETIDPDTMGGRCTLGLLIVRLKVRVLPGLPKRTHPEPHSILVE